MTANSCNSEGSRDSPSRTRWNHDATVSHSECGMSPPAKCCSDVRSFVQEVPLNAMRCAVQPGLVLPGAPGCSFLTGFSTCLLRFTGGGLPHSVTVRPRRNGCFGLVITGTFAMCVVPFQRLDGAVKQSSRRGQTRVAPSCPFGSKVRLQYMDKGPECPWTS